MDDEGRENDYVMDRSLKAEARVLCVYGSANKLGQDSSIGIMWQFELISRGNIMLSFILLSISTPSLQTRLLVTRVKISEYKFL